MRSGEADIVSSPGDQLKARPRNFVAAEYEFDDRGPSPRRSRRFACRTGGIRRPMARRRPLCAFVAVRLDVARADRRGHPRPRQPMDRLRDPDVPAWVAADSGGPPFRRLTGFLVADLLVLVGGMLGTAIRGDAVLTALAAGASPSSTVWSRAATRAMPRPPASCASARCSGLLHAGRAVRHRRDRRVRALFLASFHRLGLGDRGLASHSRDRASGRSPSTSAPRRLPRWTFAALCGVSVAAAFVLSQRLGLLPPDWAIFRPAHLVAPQCQGQPQGRQNCISAPCSASPSPRPMRLSFPQLSLCSSA